MPESSKGRSTRSGNSHYSIVLATWYLHNTFDSIMKKFFVALFLPFLLDAAPKGVPEGYKLVYKQDFADADSLKDFIDYLEHLMDP